MDTLPARPAIPGRYTIVDVSPEECLLVSATGSFSIASSERGLLQELTPLLTGDLQSEEIACQLEHLGKERVLAALRQLHDAGVLEDAALLSTTSLDPSEIQQHRSQIAFFGTFAGPALRTSSATSQLWPDIPAHGVEYQERLANASVLIVGLGKTGSLLVRNLAYAGVGHLVGIDNAAVSMGDASSISWYGADQVDQPRRSALAGLIESSGIPASFSSIPGRDGLDALHASDLAGITFAILCTDYVDPSEYETFNTVCHEAGVTWTSIRLTGFEVNIGPTIIPGETPCFICYDLRRKSNLTNYEEYLLLEHHQRSNHQVAASLAVPFGIDLAAIEAIKGIARFTQPATLAHVFSLNILTLASELHPVLRLPRCPACGAPSKVRPAVQPWQRFEEH